MNCAATTPTATHGASTDGPPHREPSGHLDRFAPAEPTEHGQSSDGAGNMASQTARRTVFESEMGCIVRQIINYDPETGEMTWFARPLDNFKSSGQQIRWNRRHAGKRAWSLTKNGYHVVSINKRQCGAHRVAWFLHYGVWPNGMIDHINHDRTDNRICNLRDVDNRSNSRNRPLPENHPSPAFGVRWTSSNRKWRSTIRTGNKHVHLGYFEDVWEAIEARRKAEMAFGYHPNHGRAVSGPPPDPEQGALI